MFGINYEEYKYPCPGWNGLHLLPVGEYIVVFPDYSGTSSGDISWQTSHNNVFRLIVPERDVDEEQYSLTFNQTYSLDDDYDVSTKYRAGERVELKLEMVFEQYYEVIVNGKEAAMIGSDGSYVVYAFIMPDKDTVIEIKEVSVEIPTK